MANWVVILMLLRTAACYPITESQQEVRSVGELTPTVMRRMVELLREKKQLLAGNDNGSNNAGGINGNANGNNNNEAVVGNGNNNIGGVSGNGNGNFNQAGTNGNVNGNNNVGGRNGNKNGNGNAGGESGNENGNNNQGGENGNANGSNNQNGYNGNSNGNGNIGGVNGIGNGNNNGGNSKPFDLCAASKTLCSMGFSSSSGGNRGPVPNAAVPTYSVPGLSGNSNSFMGYNPSSVIGSYNPNQWSNTNQAGRYGGRWPYSSGVGEQTGNTGKYDFSSWNSGKKVDVCLTMPWLCNPNGVMNSPTVANSDNQQEASATDSRSMNSVPRGPVVNYCDINPWACITYYTGNTNWNSTAYTNLSGGSSGNGNGNGNGNSGGGSYGNGNGNNNIGGGNGNGFGNNNQGAGSSGNGMGNNN